MLQDETGYQINVDGFDLEWRLEQGVCTIGGLPITSVPKNNALAELMARFHAAAGSARFALALQAAGRESSESDWRIIAGYPDFQSGYAEFAKSAAATGWGECRIINLDPERKRVVFAVENGWEGRYQLALGVCWGSALQAGKLAGYCERLFGEFCWPEQTRFIAKGDQWDEFVVEPSTRTIESELAMLQTLERSGGKSGELNVLPDQAENDLSQAYEMLAESNASLEEEIQERIAASEQLRRANERIEEINEQLRSEVAERNRAFQALAANEAILSSIFSAAPVGIGMVINRMFHEVNDYICLMTGYSRAELLGKSSQMLYRTEAEFKRIGGMTAELMKTQDSLSTETQWVAKDGRVLDIRLQGTLINQSEPARGVTFTASDITEQKHSENVIRESQAYNRLLFRDSLIPLVVMETETLIFTDCNQAAASVFGFETTDELLGKSPLDLSPAVQYSGESSVIEAAQRIDECKTHGSVIYEWHHRRPTGELWDAEVHLMRFMYQGRPFIHFTVQDITKRKQSEAELLREKVFSETLIDSLPGIFFLYDSSLHLKRWSRAHEVATGFSAEELQDWYIGDWHQDPEERRLGVAHARELLRTGVSGQIETTLVNKEGESIPYLISTTRLITPEGPAMMGMGINITARKLAFQALQESERKLLHAQKLESLGVLAGGIAHDFNNLLMAIAGNLDIAIADLDADSPTYEYLDQALTASRRAGDLTRQLLAYSGKGRFILEYIDLSQLVLENSHLLRASIAKTVSLKLDIEQDIAPIEADAGQIQQVVMNLITNASEAIGDQPGVISIKTGVRGFTAAELQESRVEEKPPAGKFVFLEVADNGSGMDRVTLLRLFDPFFSTKFTGRGLGLSAVLGIVAGHQGAIMVDSESGRGSVFRVLFPVCTVCRPPVVAAVASTTDTAKAVELSGLALVVDDEASVRLICKRFMDRFGFKTIVAVDGRDGLDLFKQHQAEVRLVILDLNMPRMNGISAFREMRSLRPDLKVILCSGFDEQEAMQHFCGEGLAEFLHKPYNLQELRDKVQAVLQADGGD